MVTGESANEPDTIESTGDLLERLSREQDAVIEQLDGLLIRIDKVLQDTISEIRLESTTLAEFNCEDSALRKAA